jgi:hypothetical protein
MSDISFSLRSIGSPSQTGQVTGAVLGYIEDLEGWTSDIVVDAQQALNDLANLRFDVGYTEPVFPNINEPSIEVPSFPGINEITVASTAFEGIRPQTRDFTITTFTPPEFTEKDYGIDIPEKPSVEWPIFNKEAPSIPDREVENIPMPELPPIPQITDVNIQDPPEYNPAEFTAEPPVDDLTVPVINFNWGESVYSSRLKTKLGDTLFENLVSGGTGLNEATEQAIYNRAISRLEEAEQAMMDELSDDIAKRGFDIPPGALLTLSSEAENKILRSRTDLNNDILVQQSNLAQKNTHFIIEQAANLEGILINYHNETQNRALDAAKFMVTSAIQIHALKLETYKARLIAYQTLAQVYKIRIEAEIAKAEFYKILIEGAKLHVELQQLYIQAYLAQLESIKTVMTIYKLRMEAVQLAAAIDKMKLDGYAVEANVYATKVNASTQRYEGYKAELSGEAIKSELAVNDVRKYAVENEAYKTKTQAELARVETLLNAVRIELETYEKDLSKYQIDSNKAIAEADIKAKNEGIKINAYSADMSGKVAALQAAVNLYDSNVRKAQAMADVSVKTADVAVRAALGEYELMVEVAKGVATVSGQLAAAAAGAVNASLHASASDSRSDSYQEAQSLSGSTSSTTSDSFIEEHIYSYSN